MTAPIALRRELHLSASPLELWPLVSNTGRFNAAIGIPEMEAQSQPGGPEKLVRASLFGLPLAWREAPFEWVEGRYFRVTRRFVGGPLELFEGGMDLSPEGGGCRLSIVSNFTARGALGDFLVRRLAGPRALAESETLVRRFEAALKSGGEDAFPEGRTRSAPNAAVLRQRADRLSQAGVEPAIARRLLRFIEKGYDDELTRMRPFELADRWGQERLATLKVFLHAVKAGLLDMSWEVLCPNCSAAPESHGTLAGLKNRSHCPNCDLDYAVDFGHSVELRFSVNFSVRQAVSKVFCVGNPAQTPFAAVQLLLEPGRGRTVEADLSAETYLLRDLAGKKRLFLRPSLEADSELRLDLTSAKEENEIRFRPGTVRLTLISASAALVRLERESWREKGATAAAVTALQDFRDLFSSEVLAPGTEIAVRGVALLFSDLKGSTALYERMGEAAAYALVRDHFDYLFEIVRRRRGAVVKTIGDAVMAVFSSGADAMEAAFEIQERVGEFNARLSPKPSVIIKLGLHQGPAIVINSNAAIDYFGTTVNVSARVQNESGGGDIVVTEAFGADPAVREVLKAHSFREEPFDIQLKGLTGAFRLRRLYPATNARVSR